MTLADDIKVLVRYDEGPVISSSSVYTGEDSDLFASATTMFTLPAADGNEMYDGVPLVRMPDGTEAWEVEVFYKHYITNGAQTAYHVLLH